MYKKNFFGKIRDNRGRIYGMSGKNYAFVKYNAFIYFVFFEGLVGKAVQIDTSVVRLQTKDGPHLEDLALRDEVISNVSGFFEYIGFQVVT